jgi:secondary thiamine-phosphate synthase enzyme
MFASYGRWAVMFVLSFRADISILWEQRLIVEPPMSTGTSSTVELHIKTSRKCQVINITPRVTEIVSRVGISDGICHVYVSHTTAAVTINENADPNIGEDLVEALNRLIPEGIWQHDKIDDNGAAHIKASIIGPNESIPVRHGKLLLGTWQAVMLVEFDGPCERQLLITVR